jgi:hypothetical protein
MRALAGIFRTWGLLARGQEDRRMQNSTLKKGLFVVIVTIVIGVILYFLPYRGAVAY